MLPTRIHTDGGAGSPPPSARAPFGFESWAEMGRDGLRGVGGSGSFGNIVNIKPAKSGLNTKLRRYQAR